jgi:4-hydroxybenzoate polyprenyltransferase
MIGYRLFPRFFRNGVISLFYDLFTTLRPKQWTKNGFIFAALVFDIKLFQIELFLKTLLGFILLCIVSGTVYLINDLVDIEKDRQHPTKRYRPIPSGQVSFGVAIPFH